MFAWHISIKNDNTFFYGTFLWWSLTTWSPLAQIIFVNKNMFFAGCSLRARDLIRQHVPIGVLRKGCRHQISGTHSWQLVCKGHNFVTRSFGVIDVGMKPIFCQASHVKKCCSCCFCCCVWMLSLLMMYWVFRMFLQCFSTGCWLLVISPSVVSKVVVGHLLCGSCALYSLFL